MEFLKKIYGKIKYFFYWLNIYRRLRIQEKNTFISLAIIIQEQLNHKKELEKFEANQNDLRKMLIDLGSKLNNLAINHFESEDRIDLMENKISKQGKRISNIITRNKKRNMDYKYTFNSILMDIDSSKVSLEQIKNKNIWACGQIEFNHKNIIDLKTDLEEKFILLKKALSNIDKLDKLSEIIHKIDDKYKYIDKKLNEKHDAMKIYLESECNKHISAIGTFKKEDKAILRLSSLEERITLLELKEKQIQQTDEIPSRLE